MITFVSTNPITDEVKQDLDQLHYWLTQCQLNGLKIRFHSLYENGSKRSIILLDGIEIQEEIKDTK